MKEGYPPLLSGEALAKSKKGLTVHYSRRKVLRNFIEEANSATKPGRIFKVITRAVVVIKCPG